MVAHAKRPHWAGERPNLMGSLNLQTTGDARQRDAASVSRMERTETKDGTELCSVQSENLSLDPDLCNNRSAMGQPPRWQATEPTAEVPTVLETARWAVPNNRGTQQGGERSTLMGLDQLQPIDDEK